jgi:hypothetical protein
VHRGDEKCIKNVDWKASREETTWKIRHKWEDNIKKDLREIGFRDVDWIHLAQDWDQWRVLMNAVMNLQVP